MAEEWRDIAGYGGKYQVSSYGNVRKRNKDRRAPFAHFLKPSANNNAGYLKVCLYHNGISKNCAIHRLVAEAFVENPTRKPCVNHKDGNKKNNLATNLEWVTYSENSRHAVATGLCDELFKLLSKRIAQFSKRGELIKVWGSLHEIERETGFSASHICKQIRHSTKNAYGYKWGYADV